MIKKLTVLSVLLLSLPGCSSPTNDPRATGDIPRRHFDSPEEKAFAEKQFAIYDPAQTENKHIYKFNAKLDKYVLLPIVDAYKFVTPHYVRTRVSDFFLNVGEVTNFTNAVLQLKAKKAGVTLSRFVINTTVGLAGTFEVAKDWGLERQPDDFGKTLGYWGAGSGAYIVLPVLGPSNVRDTIGTIADYATLYFIIPNSVQDSVPYDVVAYGLEPIDMRYSNEFRYYSTGSPFEYELVRYIVTQSRAQEIENLRKE